MPLAIVSRLSIGQDESRAAVLDDVWYGADACRQDGRAAGHGFNHRIGQAFRFAGQHQQPEAVEMVGDRVESTQPTSLTWDSSGRLRAASMSERSGPSPIRWKV